MKNMFEGGVVAELQERMLRLRADSVALWGRMEVAQTLAHCRAGVEMAMGSIEGKRAGLPGRLMGALIKPLVLRDDKPFRRNSPSMPELFSAGPFEFLVERERLMEAVERFAGAGAAGCTGYPHPFFGRLTPAEWGVLVYKHLDHHLRQFGV
jgi:hypothetical protein